MNEILDLYIQLGKTVHKDFIDGIELSDKYSDISRSILELEIAEYLKDHENAPAKEEHSCPNCSTECKDEYNFCTNCGFNLNEFYKNKQNCSVCDVLIPLEDEFCRVCGADLKKGDKDA